MGLERVGFVVVRASLLLKVEWKPGPLAVDMSAKLLVRLDGEREGAVRGEVRQCGGRWEGEVWPGSREWGGLGFGVGDKFGGKFDM